MLTGVCVCVLQGRGGTDGGRGEPGETGAKVGLNHTTVRGIKKRTAGHSDV